LVHQVNRSLKLLHRRDERRVKRLDIAILRDMRLCMTQDTLNDFFVRVFGALLVHFSLQMK
jgi:hypothetical protein